MLVVNSLHCRASTPRQRTAASSSNGVYEVARLPPFPSLPFPLLTDLALSSCYFGNWRSPRHFGCRLGTLPFPLSGTKLETSVSRAPHRRAAPTGGISTVVSVARRDCGTFRCIAITTTRGVLALHFAEPPVFREEVNVGVKWA